jgi:methylase of polypeptide subunit release factors
MLGAEGRIHLREEEHQDNNVIDVGCGKGCESGNYRCGKPTHDVIFVTSFNSFVLQAIASYL